MLTKEELEGLLDDMLRWKGNSTVQAIDNHPFQANSDMRRVQEARAKILESFPVEPKHQPSARETESGHVPADIMWGGDEPNGDARDASRYRWLRDSGLVWADKPFSHGGSCTPGRVGGEYADAFIDQRRALNRNGDV